MGILVWIVLGAIAGFITNLIMGGGEGVIATIILGIVGAVVGGYLAGTVLKVADVTGINIESIVVAVIGGVIVVAVYRMIEDRTPTTRSPGGRALIAKWAAGRGVDAAGRPAQVISSRDLPRSRKRTSASSSRRSIARSASGPGSPRRGRLAGSDPARN